jgi:hypothetical protein
MPFALSKKNKNMAFGMQETNSFFKTLICLKTSLLIKLCKALVIIVKPGFRIRKGVINLIIR